MRKKAIKLILLAGLVSFITACSEGESNLLTNSAFDIDAEGWKPYQGSVLSVDAGRLKVSNGASALRGRAIQSFPTEVGETYKVTMDYKEGNAPAYFAYVTTNPTGSISGKLEGVKGAADLYSGEKKFKFTATTLNTVLVVGNNDISPDAYSLFDEITVTKK